jgi:hypothetical protein
MMVYGTGAASGLNVLGMLITPPLFFQVYYLQINNFKESKILAISEK